MKKSLSLLMISIILLSALFGCNNAENTPQDTTTTVNSTTAASTTNESPAEDFYYEEKEDGTLKLGYNGSDSDVVVPSEIDGKIVTEIRESGFYYAKATLRSVVLPETIVVIGNNAFKDCTKLEEINLPDALIYIGMSAFSYCTSLKQITIPANSFNSSNQYEKSEYSDTGYYSFADSGLETVIFKEGVEIIPNSAFVRTKIKEIVLPSSVKQIQVSAFGHCLELESVTLNEGLVFVSGGGTFFQSKIKEIIIPKTVTDIQSDTFSGCNSLEKIKFEGDAPENFKSEHQAFPVIYTIYYHETATGFTTPEWNGFLTEIW